jgi:hypothetical protein
MKLNCPDCGRLIRAEDIALDTGWAKCSACHEVFPLKRLLPDYASAESERPAPPNERPFDAWAIVQRTPDRLMIHLPPCGMRAGAWGMLFFALFWTGFIAFWTAGALGVFFNNGQVQWENLLFASFSTPFWIVGFGMLGGVLWLARGSRTVYLDASQMVTQLRCLAWRRRRVYDRSDVQHAREGRAIVANENQTANYSPYSVEIIFTQGSFRLPANSVAEQNWLMAEINAFLQATPYRPPLFGSLSPDLD